MSEKNMLGMDMSHWKHLSGLADPYSLTENVNLKQAQLDKAFGGDSDSDNDDDPGEKFVDPRVAKMKALVAARNHSKADGDASKGKTAPGSQAQRGVKAAAKAQAKRKAQLSTLSPKQSARAERKRGEAQQRIIDVATAKKKKFSRPLNAKELATDRNEDVELTMDDLWEAFLDIRGTSVEEFDFLSNLALESNDQEIALGMLALEDEFHEIFGGVGAALGTAARGVIGAGKLAAKGVGAAAKAGVGAAKAVGSAVADNFKAGYANARTPAAAAPAPGFAPTTPPPAGPVPAMPVGATPPAQAAVPAQASQAAGSAPPQSGMNPKAAAKQQKPSLLGRIGKGIGQLRKGVKGIATAPLRAAGNLVGGAVKGYRGEDVEAWGAYLSESYGLSVDEYLEACEQAYEYGDVEMIEQLHAMDEDIFDFLRGGKKKAADQAKHAEMVKGFAKARAIRDEHGVEKTKAASVRGQQVGVKPNPVVGTSTRVPRALGDAMESVMRRQLQFSGYTPEFLEARTKEQQYAGQKAVADQRLTSIGDAARPENKAGVLKISKVSPFSSPGRTLAHPFHQMSKTDKDGNDGKVDKDGGPGAWANRKTAAGLDYRHQDKLANKKPGDALRAFKASKPKPATRDRYMDSYMDRKKRTR